MSEKISVLRNGTSWKKALLYGGSLEVYAAGNVFGKPFLTILILISFLILFLIFNKPKFAPAQIIETKPWKTFIGLVSSFFAFSTPILVRDSNSLTIKWLIIAGVTLLIVFAARYLIAFQHQAPKADYREVLEIQAFQKERDRLYRKGTLR